jgi:hypothetical protein
MTGHPARRRTDPPHLRPGLETYGRAEVLWLVLAPLAMTAGDTESMAGLGGWVLALLVVWQFVIGLRHSRTAR